MKHPTVPLFDLSREISELRSEIRDAIDVVIDSGSVVLGAQHDAFENEFATYVGAVGAVCVANGTDALEIAMACIGVKQGDLVVTVANAGGYSSIAARRLDAIPAYCDVEDETLLLSARTLEACLNELAVRPAAIVVTHLFGAMAPMPEIMDVANKWGIPVIEDCAQSIGTRLDGRHSGTFGTIATTSFYPTKNLGALGDGGAIYSNSIELLDAARHARQYGWSSKYRIESTYGRNSRLDELQAAILRVKLRRLDARIEQRQSIFRTYRDACPEVFLSIASDGFAPHLAVMRSSNRTDIENRFSIAGIGTGVHYPVLDSEQKPWRMFAESPLPVSAKARDEILSLPMFPTLRADEVARVCDVLVTLDCTR